jgi:4-amino-4-deoxy-L-arabinose transferase-like glycosyltransferase
MTPRNSSDGRRRSVSGSVRKRPRTATGCERDAADTTREWTGIRRRCYPFRSHRSTIAKGVAMRFAIDALHRNTIPRRVPWVLLAVLLAAAFVRLWGTPYGLPHIYHTDEIFEVKRALKLGAGQFDLERSFKGGLYLLLFPAYGFYFVGLKLAGAVQSRLDFLVLFFENPTGFWLIGRVMVALIGTLNVFLVYLLGKRLGGDRTGWVAAAALAVATDHVWSSHFITVDVLMVTLLTLALLAILSIERTGRIRSYVLAGTIAALATMTKLPGILIILPLLVAHAARAHREGRGLIHGLADRRLLAAAVAFLAATAVANPSFFPAFAGFAGRRLGIVPAVSASAGLADPFAVRTENTWVFYVGALRRSLGYPFLVVALAGTVYALWRRTAMGIGLVVFTLATYVAICMPAEAQYVYRRYSLPMQLALVVLGARLLDQAFRRFRVAPWLATAGVLAILALPLADITKTGVMLSRKDTRTIAKEWVEANIPAGSKIVVAGRGYECSTMTAPLRNLPSNVEAIQKAYAKTKAGWTPGTAQGELKGLFHKAAIKSLQGKIAYDLMFISAETFPQRRLDHYLESGAEYIIINPDWYAKFLSGVNYRRFPVVGDFYRDITASDRVRLRMRFEPHGGPGPVLEIYQVLSDRMSAASV